MRPLPLILAAALLSPLPLAAQTGGPVPPYVAPAKVAPPVRDGDAATPGFEPTRKDDPLKAQPDTVGRFIGAYQGAGKPRLAFFWNRQLSDTLNTWYGDQRIVSTNRSEGNTSGDFNLNQSNSAQNTVEVQRRNPGERQRPQREETWEWEFQDGFLGPFMQAGAIVLDRAAIVRLTGAELPNGDDLTTETRALTGKADLLVEVLNTPSAQANTGYELRARVIEIRTGRLLATVNSRGLREWQRGTEAVASPHGLDLPDEDDESFGPERADQRYKATNQGFERKRKPPKLAVISQNLAYNVMNSMSAQWGSPQASIPAQPSVKTGVGPAAMPGSLPNPSAMPRSGVETVPLPPPSPDEPPMPQPSRQ